MLSRELEITLNLAFKDARAKRHELMSVEHLLLALIDEPDAAKVMKACSVDTEDLRKTLVVIASGCTPQPGPPPPTLPLPAAGSK